MRRYVAVAALMVAGLFAGAAGEEAQSNSDASRTNIQQTPRNGMGNTILTSRLVLGKLT